MEQDRFSIKLKQREGVVRMLRFNEDEARKGAAAPWKVLVYDKHCSEILYPLLVLGELRKEGITLPLFLHKDRQAITDVPAVYFVRACEANIKRISDDCASQLYAGMHLNFCGGLTKKLLTDLAAKVVVTDTVHLINRVHEQYLDFVSLEHNLFSLKQHGSFVPCHLPNLTEAAAAEHVERIVNSLFSAVVTMGVAPIIRCPKNGMAEHVARALEQRLRAYFVKAAAGSGARAPFSSFQRPVLVILDRTVDLAVMVQHSWTYQAMVHDILKSDSNNVTFTQSDGGAKHSFDLDDERDWFWTENRGKQFAQVAEAVHASMDQCKESRKQFEKFKISEAEEMDSVAGKTQDLRQFASSLPQLKEREKVVNMHLKIATNLLGHINTRSLNLFVPVEEAITTGTVDKKEVAQLVGQSDAMVEDRMRLLLLYLLTRDNVSANELERLQELVKDSPYYDALHFIKKIVSFTSRAPAKKPQQAQQPSSGLLGRLSSVQLGGAASNLSDRLFSMVQSGVSNILSTNSELYITRIVDSIMEVKAAQPEVENYLYLDPKIQGVQASAVPRKTTPFRNAIVFTLGGGNYVEYQNLQNLAKATGRNIIYGSTEILTAEQFMAQLDELGKAMKPAPTPAV